MQTKKCYQFKKNKKYLLFFQITLEKIKVESYTI